MSRAKRKPVDRKQVMKIARVAHEAIRAWQAANRQPQIPSWSDAPKWMRDSTVEGVEWRLKNPDAHSSAQHDQWMEEKRATGWSFGRRKDAERKTHPLMVPYEDLSDVERAKDALFAGVVRALSDELI